METVSKEWKWRLAFNKIVVVDVARSMVANRKVWNTSPCPCRKHRPEHHDYLEHISRASSSLVVLETHVSEEIRILNAHHNRSI